MSQSPQSDWRSLRNELDSTATQLTRLQTAFARGLQHFNETEAHLRARVQDLEDERRLMQHQLDALRRENGELEQAVREHVCTASAADNEPAEFRRLRYERDTAERHLRHALKLVHDLSGRFVITPSPEVVPSDRSETHGEHAGQSAPATSSDREARPSVPPDRPLNTHSRGHSPRGPSPSVRDLDASSSAPAPENTATHADEAEEPADEEEEGSDGTCLTNVTYEEQVPVVRLPSVRQPSPQPQDQAHDAGPSMPEEFLDFEVDPVSPVGWDWMFVGLPEVCQVRYGPMSNAEIATKLGFPLADIEGWEPPPSNRVMIRNDIALYYDPTYIELRLEPRRTVVVNWGGPRSIHEARQYIWTQGTAGEYHTFMLVSQPGQFLEWWYVGKLQWESTRRVPPWPTNPEVKLKIAHRMKRKWGVDMRKEVIAEHIEAGRLVQLNIELISNPGLVEESRRFIEEVLDVGNGPLDSGPSGS